MMHTDELNLFHVESQSEHTEEIFGSHLLRLQRVTDAIHILSRNPHDVLPSLC